MTGALVIRPQVPTDAEDLVDVHLRSWRWAYTGLIPDASIDLLFDQRASRIERVRTSIERADPAERRWAAELEDRIVGLAMTGPSGDPDAGQGTGEVYAIYLAPDVAGRGFGRRLLAHAVDDLRARGFARATLWVLDTNARARRFYERAGWRPDGATKVEERPGATLDEVRYGITFRRRGQSRSPRPVAVCAVIHDGRILVSEVPDPVKGVTGYRPLGGGIEAGESAAQAVVREFREELDVALGDVREIGVVDSPFVFLGKARHEMVTVCTGSLGPDDASRSAFVRIDRPGRQVRVTWEPLRRFVEDRVPLYPDGLLDLLRANGLVPGR